MGVKRHFIAGAVCPKCGQRDKIVMLAGDTEKLVCECVRCDYRAVMVRDEPVVTRMTDVQSSTNDDVQVIRWQPEVKKRHTKN